MVRIMSTNSNHARRHRHVNRQRRQASFNSRIKRRLRQMNDIHAQGLRSRRGRTSYLARVTRARRRHVNRRQRRRQNRPSERRGRRQVRNLRTRRRRVTARQRHKLRRHGRHRRPMVSGRRPVQPQVTRYFTHPTERNNFRHRRRRRHTRPRQRRHMRQYRQQARVHRQRCNLTPRLRQYNRHANRHFKVVTRRLFSRTRVTAI